MPIRDVFDSGHDGRPGGQVRSWASLLDDRTREQAMMISRGLVTFGHVALMPDAHLGKGACVGTAIRTSGGVYPAAVGVDIGCGIDAALTDLTVGQVPSLTAFRGLVAKRIPVGVGRAHASPVGEALDFWQDFGPPPGLAALRREAQVTGLEQFGTLGAGNHFLELSADDEDRVWALVHSGSRGLGNQLAVHHIRVAQELCASLGVELEHRDLAFLPEGHPEFDHYLADLVWAQTYAAHQRRWMLDETLRCLSDVVGSFDVGVRISCHHNYTVRLPDDTLLSRKGAIDASAGTLGVIPGSMGTDTYIVRGLGNAEAYETAPHGAGRLMARGRRSRGTGAWALLDVDDFRAQMDARGVVWDDRQADDLLDEAPLAYKPIETIIADSADLVTPVARLHQLVNRKG